MPPQPSGGGRTSRWLIAAVLVLAAAVTGTAVAIAVGSRDVPEPVAEVRTVTAPAAAAEEEATPDGDRSVDGGTRVPAPDDGGVAPDARADDGGRSSALDGVSKPQMRAEIAELLRDHHQNIVNGDFKAAWNQLTSRKQRQKISEGGYQPWAAAQASMSPYLVPVGLDVSIEDVNSSTGVVRVDVNGMGWTKADSPCSTWSGITWVRYEDDTWRYDPGYSTTPQRRAEWQPRRTETMGWGC